MSTRGSTSASHGTPFTVQAMHPPRAATSIPSTGSIRRRGFWRAGPTRRTLGRWWLLGCTCILGREGRDVQAFGASHAHVATKPWTPPRSGPALELASVAAIDVNRGPPRVRAAAAATVIMATISASVRSTRQARCRYATDQRACDQLSPGPEHLRLGLRALLEQLLQLLFVPGQLSCQPTGQQRNQQLADPVSLELGRDR